MPIASVSTYLRMLAVLVCVGLLYQQDTASAPAGMDFSGRWTLVVALPTDADVPTTLTVRQSIRRTNIRGEPMTPYYDQIAIDQKSSAGMRSDTFMIGIRGGTVGGGVSSTGARIRALSTRHAVTWNGDSLVFELGTSTGDAPGTGDWTERRETWALQPNGELAITIATSGSAGPAQTVAALYRRF
jgi:hypothetical protein